MTEGDKLPTALLEEAVGRPKTIPRVLQEAKLAYWDHEVDRMVTNMQEDREYFIKHKSWKRPI